MTSRYPRKTGTDGTIAGTLSWQAAAPKADLSEEAARAMSRLSQGEREVLLLWDAGLCYREIAERIGMLPEIVGELLARARQHLVMAHDSLLGG
jgi:DNA-directed RNA polymerase specialized sigma24 family protein